MTTGTPFTNAQIERLRDNAMRLAYEVRRIDEAYVRAVNQYHHAVSMNARSRSM